MARVRIHIEDDMPWIAPDDVTPEDDKGKYTEEEMSALVRFREEGTDNSPQLLEIRYQPNTDIRLHAHDEDEIIYVRDGELCLGDQVLGPGSSLFVPGNTLYRFSAGPEGLQILNFRPRKDLTYILKDEFLARRSTESP